MTPQPAPPRPARSAPVRALRGALVDELTALLDLYLSTQPRDLRRAALTAGKALGWHLDRRLAADLVDTLDDDVVMLVVASLFDRAERLLAVGMDRDDDVSADLAELNVDDPELRARAADQLRAALARAQW